MTLALMLALAFLAGGIGGFLLRSDMERGHLAEWRHNRVAKRIGDEARVLRVLHRMSGAVSADTLCNALTTAIPGYRVVEILARLVDDDVVLADYFDLRQPNVKLYILAERLPEFEASAPDPMPPAVDARPGTEEKGTDNAGDHQQ